MSHITPVKLIREYDVGNMTRHELLIRLEQTAVIVPCEEIAAVSSADVVDELREAARHPPHSVEDCRVFCIGMWGSNFDWEAEMREQARLLFEGRWQWHRYFHRTGT